MNIEFVESLTNCFIKGDRQGLITLLKQVRKSEEKLKHKNNVVRLENLIKRIPSNTFVASSLDISNKTTAIDTKLFERNISHVPIENTILEEESKPLISNFLEEWHNRTLLLSHDIAPSNKLLFFGPSGTGKTQLAYGIANKLDMPLILVKLDEVISSYLGKTGKNIREIFDIAKQEDVVLFLDEIDTLAKQRDDSKELGELKRVVTVLLQNIDQFPSNSILIGATNHESLLDSAIWRRFQVKLSFKEPTIENRYSMFKMYLDKFADKKEVELLAKISEDLTGAAIFEVSNNLKRNAILKKEDKISVEQIISEFSNALKSKENKSSNQKKASIYKLCKDLKKSGLTLVEISKITGIAYTTLRDNIK